MWSGRGVWTAAAVVLAAVCDGSLVVAQCEPEETAKLTASDGAAGDLFGYRVSISGDVAVIGALADNDNGSDSGSAYIFRYDGATWVQEQKLTASDGAADDLFGVSVSISGDVAVIGAYRDDDNGIGSGSAYLFRYDGATWVEEAKLTASDGAEGDGFGESVSISGDVAVIAARRDDDNGNGSGSAYIFRYDGATWVQEQKLTASDGAEDHWFGWSVSISGDVAVVGALDDDNGIDSGSAYIFRYDGATWVQEQKLTASDGAAGDLFGHSVSISVDAAVIGAPHDNDNGSDSGSAYIFRYDGATWVQEQKLTASDGAAEDNFGVSVSISGDAAVIGAPYDNDSGSACIFRYDGAMWVQEQKLTASDGAAEDNVGVSVSISGDVAVVGAWRDDDNGDSSGSAYVFDFGHSAASYVTMTVHGQIADAFTEDTWETPSWVTDVPTSLHTKTAQINALRCSDGLEPIGFRSVVGDWGQATGDGAKLLLESRWLCFIADGIADPDYRDRAFELAENYESNAREEISNASRASASSIGIDLLDLLSSLREQHESDHPIFLDIISHSRGATVTSGILAQLAQGSVGQGPLEVNVVYLDIIDPHPSEPDLPRPHALAGHLLGDRIVSRAGNEIAYNYHADCAWRCAPDDCLESELAKWFGSGFVCLLTLGQEAVDEFIRQWGYPKGHARPYLEPADDALCPDSTHFSLQQDYTDALIALEVGSSPPPTCPPSFVETSQLGRLISTPSSDIPVPIPFVSALDTSRSDTGEFVHDPLFDEAAAIVRNTIDLLASDEFQGLLTSEFDRLRESLETTETTGFPAESVWALNAGDINAEYDGDEARASMIGEATMSQHLDFASVGHNQLGVEVNLLLTEPTSEVTIAIHGDGLDASILVDTTAYELGVRHTVSMEASRMGSGGPTEDVITLSGSDCSIYSVSVVAISPCPADLDGSGAVDFADVLAILAAWGNAGGPEDLDESGFVDFGDLLVVLGSWGPCP